MATESVISGERLVHESEVQRHHVRIKLPVTASLNGKEYAVKNFSAGGFCIATDPDFIPLKKCQDSKLRFAFPGFSFDVELKAHPVYYRRQKGIAGYRFTDPDPRQLSLLTYVIKSQLAGVLVTEGDIINVASRNNFTTPKAAPAQNNTRQSTLRRLLPMALIAVAGVIAIFLVLGSLYENTVLVKSYTGIVQGNTYSVRAPADGYFTSLIAENTTKVLKDQPLAVINTASAPPIDDGTGITQGTVLKSPCDCLIVNKRPRGGEFLAAGDTAFSLLPRNDTLWVTATVQPEQIHRLQYLDDVFVKVIGEGNFAKGSLSEFIAPEIEGEPAKVQIKMAEPLAPEMYGRLAYVEFVVN